MKFFTSFIFIVLLLSGCGSSSENTSEPTKQENQDINNSQNHSDINTTDVSADDSPCENNYPEEVMNGQALYNEHCKVCHASDAKSGLFDIRGTRKVDIDTAMEEVPDMVELNLAENVSSDERILIAEYLNIIRDDPDVEFAQECSNSSLLTKASLGSRLFFDTNLSLRKTMSCSTCHNPGNAFVDARFKDENTTNPVKGALSVGDDGITLGGRNTPTAMYAQFSPEFTKNSNAVYVGGQFHDGRAATLKDQAKGPFLDPAEMMMPDAQSVVNRVMENQQYISDMKILYGDNIFDDMDQAYDAVAESIAVFEKTDTFAPFSSKYDRSKLDKNDPDYYSMSTLEKQGYEIFFDTNRTNCVLCHSINSKSESSDEVFTNFKYENIGTPKNIEALMARDGSTNKTDLLLGGRANINDTAQYGKTKVPTLRNIAVTGPYMSNGVFKELRTVLEFYNHMNGNNDNSLNPETNQLWREAEVSSTINHELLKMEKLSEDELDALEAFLKLLTDKQYESLLKE